MQRSGSSAREKSFVTAARTATVLSRPRNCSVADWRLLGTWVGAGVRVGVRREAVGYVLIDLLSVAREAVEHAPRRVGIEPRLPPAQHHGVELPVQRLGGSRRGGAVEAATFTRRHGDALLGSTAARRGPSGPGGHGQPTLLPQPGRQAFTGLPHARGSPASVGSDHGHEQRDAAGPDGEREVNVQGLQLGILCGVRPVLRPRREPDGAAPREHLVSHEEQQHGRHHAPAACAAQVVAEDREPHRAHMPLLVVRLLHLRRRNRRLRRERRRL
eukprot:scaffold23081_cov61-Phaeocystis_antarctica.AAC.7